MSTLRADDGTELEAKEGVVLDSEGRPLTAQKPTVRSFSFSLPVPALVGAVLIVPLALATGIAFFGILAVFLTVFMLVGFVSKILRHL